MSEEQEIERTETQEDVEGHTHHPKKLDVSGWTAEDNGSEEDDVEGHHHSPKKLGWTGDK